MRRGGVVRCATAVSSVISTLAALIEKAPAEGIPLTKIEADVTGLVGDVPGAPPILHALAEVSDRHFVHNNVTVVPCAWSKVMPCVVGKMPPEGVTESALIYLIQKEVPQFTKESVPGVGMARWVSTWFPHLLNVSRSAATNEPIYRLAPPTCTAEAAAVHYALVQLGRQDLPVWTDVGKIVPLLPASIAPPEGEWTSFLASPGIRDVFDVRAEVMFSLAPTYRETVVLVDGTSLTRDESLTILQRVNLSGGHSMRVFRKRHSPPHGESDELIGSFLDPEHFLHAAVSRIVSEAHADERAVVVFCSDATREPIATALAEFAAGCRLEIHSPSGVVSLSPSAAPAAE